MLSAEQKLKILGLAFAGADLAFEVNGAGAIKFALGAVEQVAGLSREDIIGADWTNLVAVDDAALLKSLIDSLAPGERKGPLRVALRPRKVGGLVRYASLSAFRLPENSDGLSCAISLGAPATDGVRRNARGLLDRAVFEESANTILAEASRCGQPLQLALVEMTGLNKQLGAMDAAAEAQGRQRLAAALRVESYSAIGACEVANDRFALLKVSGDSLARISQRLAEAVGGGIEAVVAEVTVDGARPEQGLRAVRYALNRYIETGAAETVAGLETVLEQTAQETIKFRAALAAGAFSMVYQPIIDLARGTAHHFEALARFAGTTSPAATIELAEEVGVIADFDLAVAKIVTGVVRKAGAGVKVAINLSAITLMTPRCMDTLVALTAADPHLRQRILLEVTETQKLSDLGQANRVLAALRRLGHAVCLDDFGSGAATLDYLSQLEVDFVKIDGRYIQSLYKNPRDAVVVKHVAALCKELGVGVIAEKVESQETADAVRALGVPMAQGWLYGQPTLEPVWAPAGATPMPARRVGMVEQWG